MKLGYYEKLVLKKFKDKKYYRNGFLRYSYWGRRLKDMLGDKLNKYELKKIFNNLLLNNYFNKQKTDKSSYVYQFVSKEKPIIDESKFTVTFD